MPWNVFTYFYLDIFCDKLEVQILENKLSSSIIHFKNRDNKDIKINF